MARKNLDAKFEIIQDTLTNPEFKSKLGRILNEMTPSELAYVIESSPPQERKIIWDLIQLDTEGEVLGELDENLRDDLLEGMDPEEISKAISDLEKIDEVMDKILSFAHLLVAENADHEKNKIFFLYKSNINFKPFKFPIRFFLVSYLSFENELTEGPGLFERALVQHLSLE